MDAIPRQRGHGLLHLLRDIITIKRLQCQTIVKSLLNFKILHQEGKKKKKKKKERN
jgi:hypothetical protein